MPDARATSPGRLQVHASVSVDGRIADSAGGLDWWVTDTDFQEHIDAVLTSLGAMVFGRTAFDALAEYWPHADADDVSPTQIDLMHRLPKYVMTHRPLDSDWNNSHALDMSTPHALAELKSTVDGAVAVFAGARAATTALDSGDVDELCLVVHPIVLGCGDHLIGELSSRVTVRLAEVTRYDSGMLVQRYTIGS